MKPFSIIVAFDASYGIGKNGQLPWSLPSDLKHFKTLTTALRDPSKKNAVVMGRKTWDSLPLKFRPLPGRVNLVLSRQEGLALPDEVIHAKTLDESLSRLSSAAIENVFVIGGAEVYAQAITHPSCQKIHVTHVAGDFACDAFFPAISRVFIPVSASEPCRENGIDFHFCDYFKS